MPCRREAWSSLCDGSKWVTALFVILVVALALRLSWLHYAKTIPVSDFEHYRVLAESLLNHHQFGYPEPTAFRPPAYPMFLAGLMLVSRSVSWLSLWSVVLSTLNCLLVWYLAHVLFGRRDVALAASLVCALNPSFVFYSPVLGTEHLFAIVILVSTLLALVEGSHPLLRAGCAGLLLGIAILTRGEALFYAPVICGAFLWRSWARAGWSRGGILPATLCVAVMVCVVVPWYLRNEVVVGTGAGLGTNGGVTFYQGHNPEGYGFRADEDTPIGHLNEIEKSKEGYRQGLQYIRDNPKSLLRSILLGTLGLYMPSDGSVAWSTRLPRNPDEAWRSMPLVFIGPAKYLALIGDSLLLAYAFLSILTLPTWPRRAVLVLGGFIFLNWVLYAVVFWGAPRYLFFAQLLFCVFVGKILVKILTSEGTQYPVMARPTVEIWPPAQRLDGAKTRHHETYEKL